jgi:hypothetical protein
MSIAGRFLLALCFCAVPALVGAVEKSDAARVAPSSWANDLTPITDEEWTYSRIAHLLERAGFGGTPEEIAALAAMTPAEAVNRLVDYETIDDSKLPRYEMSPIYPHGHKLVSLQKIVPKATITGKAFGIKAKQDGELPYQPAINEFYTLLISEHWEMHRAAQWWAERMLLTPRPLQEKLALFWHGHFATSQEKVLNCELMLGQIATLRKLANGNFRDILIAVAQDPAMLIWLDNRDNVKGKPNENFAREVMELFAMGEGKGYTEADIRELARALTGWTMRPIETVKDDPSFVDDKSRHDDGVKTFLGEKGAFTGYEAIDIILKQPATSRFISGKIYRYFVREDPSPELTTKLAKLLVDSKYDLKPLLKAIFLSRDFYSEPSCGTQIKSPVDFLVSTYKKLGLRTIPGIPDFDDTARTLGQSLFFPPNVAGWSGGRCWINPATLLVRGNFVQTLLFPDPSSYVAPDKVVAEGYRAIPLKFRQYHVTPQIWNPKTQHMEPVSLAEYDRFLAGLSTGAMKAMGSTSAKPKRTEAEMMAGPRQQNSKMAQLANTERYNLAVGVYTGFVEGYNRVKPIPRTPVEVDFVAMVKSANVASAEEVVDYFCRRFLSVDLQTDRRAAAIDFLRHELSSDRVDYKDKNLDAVLRRTVHLILSAPEYQLG